MNWNNRNLWPTLVSVVFAVVCFCFFQLFYPSHFYFKGQNQLFLMSWSYISTMFSKPAWTACLAGEFLTQFYYLEVAGATILTASLSILFWLTYQALNSLRLKRMNMWLSLTVALAVTVREASCHLFYGYTLSSTYALIGGLLMLDRKSTRLKSSH